MLDNQPSPSKELEEQKGEDLSGKLLPCPFCGRDAKMQKGESREWYSAYCPQYDEYEQETDCIASPESHECYDTEIEAIRAWNTRPKTYYWKEAAKLSEQLTATQQKLDSAVEALKAIAEIERPVDMCTWDKGMLIRLIKQMESIAEVALAR